MENIVYLAFRRMRRPLLTLIVTYTIAVLGLVLIPGQDAAGNPWRMDFFHAFYFVSFTATTIGFGEIPHTFTDAQRLWVTISLYGSVVVWFYAIGNLLSLVQDRAFQQALTQRRFTQQVRQICDPFYLICGYGETGSALTETLTDRHQMVVAIDIDSDRVNLVKLENLREFVPAMHGDAALPDNLLRAGLEHRLCRGVVALTNDNEVNLKIAITSKLLHPRRMVICRADSHDVEANMKSFGTDYIIDPYDTFAAYLAISLQAPGLHLLHEWLTGPPGGMAGEPLTPPNAGHWIVCGYGRFGRAVCRRLEQEGIKPVVVEANPEVTGAPEGCVVGRGTEAETLQLARIEEAVGLVAGTDDDANNLSIIMTARDLNSKLFVVARQNSLDNAVIFPAVAADMVMHPSSIIANKIRVLLGTPLLYEFISLAKHQDDQWACSLISRIAALTETQIPDVWEVRIDEQSAFALCGALEKGRVATLDNLVTHPGDREDRLPCIPLMMRRDDERTVLPAGETHLKVDDYLLLCGRESARNRMAWTLQNKHALNYVLTGEARAQGWLWRRLARRWPAANGGGKQ